MLFTFLEKLIIEVSSSCLKEIKIVLPLEIQFFPYAIQSLTCILSELISFEHKSLQYLHAFCVDLITLK